MAKQTLSNALRLLKARREFGLNAASVALEGLPEGDDEGTTVAFRSLVVLLPKSREYSVHEFVDAVYELDSERRYRTREKYRRTG